MRGGRGNSSPHVIEFRLKLGDLKPGDRQSMSTDWLIFR